MALKLVFNPVSGKFDYVDINTVVYAVSVPRAVANGVTFTVLTNTQVCYSNTILTQAGGIVLTAGTGVLTYIN
jgi:hypothetical protein